MSYKCLIVDDEPIAQNIVKGFVQQTPQLELVGICDNAMEALKILRTRSIDLLFLDIEMPMLSGLSFLKTLPHAPATIITTAYREFAVEGFELNVVDYLLKPFSFERFLRAVNKLETPQPAIHKAPQGQDYHYFKADRKQVKVFFDDILFIEGMSNYVRIHLKDRQLIVYQRLTDLEKTLPAQAFIRIHRSYIISLRNIEAYDQNKVEIAGRNLPIGATYRAGFANVIQINK